MFQTAGPNKLNTSVSGQFDWGHKALISTSRISEMFVASDLLKYREAIDMLVYTKAQNKFVTS